MKTFVIIFALVLAVVSGIALVSIIRGWVFSVLWGWFVVPLFPDLPRLSIPLAIGIALVVAMLTYQNQYQGPDKRTKTEKNVAFMLLYVGPLITLFFGWVVHLFM